MGFHAIPSMAQVHMHVISQDFDSPCLKTKRHWNSFNTEYFISHSKVLEQLEQHGNFKKEEDKKELLSKDLQCNQCSYKPKNMPDLKLHLKSHLKWRIFKDLSDYQKCRINMKIYPKWLKNQQKHEITEKNWAFFLRSWQNKKKNKKVLQTPVQNLLMFELPKSDKKFR